MSANAQTIAFIDLNAQRERLEPDLSRAIAEVIASGFYIGGPKVQELEAALAAASGSGHCITCANGTDALTLVLRAWGIGPGDAVFVPAFTFAATAGAVAICGATPVFVDVAADTFNMEPAGLTEAVAAARQLGLKPAALIPVDMFGQPADYPALEAIARDEGLRILADAAQSFGARLGNRRVGTMGDAAAVSFYPSKPLGCYGDGGAVFTDDADLAERLRSVRAHGAGAHRYEHVRIGVNSRLDAIQAVVLLHKLRLLEGELELRERVARRYDAALSDCFATPRLRDGATSSWAQYTLRTERRDAVAAACAAAGVPTAVHYPIALSNQPAYRHFPTAPGGVPVSEALAATVLSLPMHPYLDSATQDRIVAVVREAAAPPMRMRAAGG